MLDDTMIGNTGQILRINLTNNEITSEGIGEKLRQYYIGGAGFVVHYLWNELEAGIDALSPDNKLIFALGPVSGIKMPGASRNCIGAKSPLTGGIAKSEVGGHWPAEFKRTGYDAIIIEGKAEKPVYLWITDQEVSIKNATHLWGKETKDAEDLIKGELGDKRIQIALIGSGGENMVRYACIMNGLHDAAGRGGLGAVMGSKNLKAVAVRGKSSYEIFDNDFFNRIVSKMSDLRIPALSDCGTGGPEIIFLEETGNLPVRNFRDGLFPEIEQIHAGIMKDEFTIGMRGCYACHIRCKKVVQFDEPYHVDAVYGGPEYETIASLGSNCGISNIKAIAKASERCNAHSLDTISTGVTISFAMECFESGLLNKRDTGGIEMKFGNEDALLQSIELIAKREGFGNFLAEGSARMSKKIGKGSEEFAIHVKGLEAAMHDPRVNAGLGLGYMVNPHGADHCASLFDLLFLAEPMIGTLKHLGIREPLPPDEISPLKVCFARLTQLKKIVDDCTAVCAFMECSLDEQAEMIRAVTGWDTSPIELMRISERIINVMRLFNLREGFSSDDDVLPGRFFKPKTDGVLAKKSVDQEKIEEAKKYYYTLMGWSAEGVPLREKVEELGIESR